METVLFCTLLLLITSCVFSASETNSNLNNGSRKNLTEHNKPLMDLSKGDKHNLPVNDEQDDLTTTTEEAEVNRDGILWARAYRASDQNKTAGNKNTSNHMIVVMPGLPGLPGLPGNPGQATMHTRKSSGYPDYKNCRFNVSGNGVFLCNYTNDGRNDNLSSEESRQIPTYRHWYYTFGRRPGFGKYRSRLEHNNNNNDNHTKTNDSNKTFTFIRLTNDSSFDNKNVNGDIIVQKPVLLDYNITPTVNNNETNIDEEIGSDDSDEMPMRPIVISKEPWIRPPEGPEARQLHFEAVAMELDEDTYNFPYLPVINIPPFQQIFAPGEPNIVIGQPGMPGKPGMPGTAGVSVVSTTADSVDKNLELSPSVKASPLILSSPVVPGVVPPLIHTGALPQTGTLPLSPYSYSAYGVPGVQSSSSFYGGNPGSLVSSQAVTGIGQAIPPYGGIPIGSPGYPSGGINPLLPQTGYPTYPGMQPYPYPPGYPISQVPLPGYPAGYPISG